VNEGDHGEGDLPACPISSRSGPSGEEPAAVDRGRRFHARPAEPASALAADLSRPGQRNGETPPYRDLLMRGGATVDQDRERRCIRLPVSCGRPQTPGPAAEAQVT